MLEAVEPCLRTEDEHVLGLLRAVTAPLGPALIRASWFGVEKKLIEHHLNIAHSQAFSEMSDALLLVVVDLPIADKNR